MQRGTMEGFLFAIYPGMSEASCPTYRDRGGATDRTWHVNPIITPGTRMIMKGRKMEKWGVMKGWWSIDGESRSSLIDWDGAPYVLCNQWDCSHIQPLYAGWDKK